MAGSWRICLGILLAWSLNAGETCAAGECFGLWLMPRTVAYYSYYPSVVYAPAWGSPACCGTPSPIVPQTIFATPTPAPPSSLGEPPLNKKQTKSEAKDGEKPVIIATRALSGGTTSSRDLCRVGFWNLTGREVTLVVEGKSWTLARDRAITLDLPHDFAWQIDDRSQQVERIPDGQSLHEIVVR